MLLPFPMSPRRDTMARFAKHDRVKLVSGIAPVAGTATWKAPTAGIDVAGFDSVTFVIFVGAMTGTGTWNVRVEESDDTTDGNFAHAADADVIDMKKSDGTAVKNDTDGLAITPVTDNGKIFVFSYVGKKRYVRLQSTADNITASVHSVLAILG